MSAIMVAILDFLKTLFSAKIAANFLEFGRKHVFTVSKMNIIKSRVEKNKLEKNLVKKMAVF